MVARGRQLPVIVITGPSGAGKGTLIRALLERISDLELAVSATTRLQRSGEEDGREYYFLSDGEFAHRVARGDFLEHVTYVSGQRYGTLRSEVDRIAAKGGIAVLELETEGALNVAEEIPTAVTIFVTAPVRGARAASARAGDGERRRDRASGSISRRASSRRPARSATWWRTTSSTAPSTSSESIVRSELAAAGTMPGS